jgi:hypothetical protein
MSESLTEEQILDRRKASMGETLGELYSLLSKELVWLYVSWSEYRVLYGTSEVTIQALNSAAPRFFYYLDYLMWHDVLLHICRLTDPPASAGRKNLTLASLPLAIPEAHLKGEVEALIKEAQSKSKFARDWRNRHLAHRDLQKAQNPEVHALAAASREKVEEALTSMAEVLNRVLGHYEDTYMDYRSARVWADGSSSLLKVLRAGVAALQASEERY